MANLSSPEGVLAFAKGTLDCLSDHPKDQVHASGMLLPVFLFLNGFKLADSLGQLAHEKYADRSTDIGDFLDECLRRYGPVSIPTLRWLFRAYYDLRCQQQLGGRRFHKGKELYHEGLCLQAIGLEDAAAKSVALAVIEDTLTFPTEDEVKESHAYIYLASRLGRFAAQRLIDMALEHKNRGKLPPYPEMVLDLAPEMDLLLPSEALKVPFRVNQALLHTLREEARSQREKALANGRPHDGKAWEKLGQYLISSIAGIQISRRRELSRSAEYDLVFRISDPNHPLAGLFGDYLVVEAKDWAGPVDAATVRDFLGKLFSLEVRAGILFSRNGITGKEKPADGAWLEVFKAYHRHHVIIIVLDSKDVDQIEQGDNLVSILLRAYQRVRFDLFMGDTNNS